MARRHFPRSEPPPVASPRVPDVARDKGIRLNLAQRRALKQGQLAMFEGCGPVGKLPEVTSIKGAS